VPRLLEGEIGGGAFGGLWRLLFCLVCLLDGVIGGELKERCDVWLRLSSLLREEGTEAE